MGLFSRFFGGGKVAKVAPQAPSRPTPQGKTSTYRVVTPNGKVRKFIKDEHDQVFRDRAHEGLQHVGSAGAHSEVRYRSNDMGQVQAFGANASYKNGDEAMAAFTERHGGKLYAERGWNKFDRVHPVSKYPHGMRPNMYETKGTGFDSMNSGGGSIYPNPAKKPSPPSSGGPSSSQNADHSPRSAFSHPFQSIKPGAAVSNPYRVLPVASGSGKKKAHAIGDYGDDPHATPRQIKNHQTLIKIGHPMAKTHRPSGLMMSQQSFDNDIVKPHLELQAASNKKQGEADPAQTVAEPGQPVKPVGGKKAKDWAEAMYARLVTENHPEIGNHTALTVQRMSQKGAATHFGLKDWSFGGKPSKSNEAVVEDLPSRPAAEAGGVQKVKRKNRGKAQS
ncbi:hypothetical protein UFOVP142_30 [uncultured Caudovirales phage]|uniref:Uncharacterized protein n=1 Tax=uncultured Caudovirales phage TaxID=2100421 RepID=A0A6J7XKN8_9CAUD|nr:hypothetical protein UFOVP142_30 [uncultured Caudovirales phage]